MRLLLAALLAASACALPPGVRLATGPEDVPRSPEPTVPFDVDDVPRAPVVVREMPGGDQYLISTPDGVRILNCYSNQCILR